MLTYIIYYKPIMGLWAAITEILSLVTKETGCLIKKKHQTT